MADFIHVNLLPIEYRIVKKDYSYLLDLRIIVSVSVLASICILYLIGQSYFQASLAGKREALAKIEAEIAENSYVANKIRELEKLRDDKNAKNHSLKSISVSKKKWVSILEGLNKSMPLNMWIESIKQNEGKETEMDLRGRTLVFPEIAQYMLELEKDNYFKKVQLGSIELKTEQDGKSFLFTIKISINPDVGIDQLVHEVEKESYL